MKKTDIAMIILIAATSVFISFFVAQAIFGRCRVKVRRQSKLSKKLIRRSLNQTKIYLMKMQLTLQSQFK